MRTFNIFIVFLSIFVVVQSCHQSQNYCSLCDNHVYCSRPSTAQCSRYKQVEAFDLSEATRNYVVHLVNDLRNFIANGSQTHPPLKMAADMSTITWSCELANLAKLNVAQCAMRHDRCRAIDGHPYAGQNLAQVGMSNGFYEERAAVQRSFNMWFDERKDTTQSDIDKYNSSKGAKIGHFTQLMKRDAMIMGCAGQKWFDGQFYQTLIACNFGATNMIDEPIYHTSKAPATKCKTGKNAEFKALCSANETF